MRKLEGQLGIVDTKPIIVEQNIAASVTYDHVNALIGTLYPALEPFGTGISGTARQGVIPSAYPISNSIP